MALWDLSTILWRERQLVNLLEQGASAGFALHAAELDRALVVHSLARTLDLDDDVTLRDLTASLPAPWPTVFDDHLAALEAAEAHCLPPSLADFLR